MWELACHWSLSWLKSRFLLESCNHPVFVYYQQELNFFLWIISVQSSGWCDVLFMCQLQWYKQVLCNHFNSMPFSIHLFFLSYFISIVLSVGIKMKRKQNNFLPGRWFFLKFFLLLIIISYIRTCIDTYILIISYKTSLYSDTKWKKTKTKLKHLNVYTVSVPYVYWIDDAENPSISSSLAVCEDVWLGIRV